MKLVIATPLYPPEPGGPATYAKLLEKGLPGQGIGVTVVKFSDVRRYPKLIRHLAYFWRVYAAAKEADAVLALDPVSVGLPSLWAARLRHATFVVKIVGDYAWEQGVQRFGITDTLDIFTNRMQVPFSVAVLRAAQTYVAKSARSCIVPSEYLKGIIRSWGIPDERIKVIYNAIELEGGGTVPEEVAAQPRPRIVSVGRLVPWKHVDGLIDAVAMLPTLPLAVVGDGPERVALEARAQEKLDARVTFTGALSHADTLAVMRMSDIFILNSSYEGLSHVLIEALMLGMAVIATGAGGNTELIRDDENGLVVPPRDPDALVRALERFANDAALRVRLGAAAESARSQFSADTMYARTARLLMSVIAV